MIFWDSFHFILLFILCLSFVNNPRWHFNVETDNMLRQWRLTLTSLRFPGFPGISFHPPLHLYHSLPLCVYVLPSVPHRILSNSSNPNAVSSDSCAGKKLICARIVVILRSLAFILEKKWPWNFSEGPPQYFLPEFSWGGVGLPPPFLSNRDRFS